MNFAGDRKTNFRVSHITLDENQNYRIRDGVLMERNVRPGPGKVWVLFSDTGRIGCVDTADVKIIGHSNRRFIKVNHLKITHQNGSYKHRERVGLLMPWPAETENDAMVLFNGESEAECVPAHELILLGEEDGDE